MLYAAAGSRLIRLQTPFIDNDEVDRLVEFIGHQQGYPEPYFLPEVPDENDTGEQGFDPSEVDDLFAEAAKLMVTNQSGSTSLLQRRFGIGYNRAGRIVDQLERAGIVGPQKGSKPREVFYPDDGSLEQYLNTLV
jgi:S-DNA-T family DNA segregation ATPase FtsK/SpoIIIE